MNDPYFHMPLLIPWKEMRLIFLCNAIRTRPQILEGTLLTLQETLHKLYLHVYDEKGRHVGLNYDRNQIEEEISCSRYLDLNGTIVIFLPSNVTRFRYVVDAKYASTLSENYTIIITNLKNGTLASEFRKSDTIKQNEKQEFAVVVSHDGREIKVEIVKVPLWQISLYGIPLHIFIIVIVIVCALLLLKHRTKLHKIHKKMTLVFSFFAYDVA